MTPVRAVVFDIGGVLVEWDPRRLYRTMFDDPDAMEDFLATVVTDEWNATLDAGRSFAEAVAELVARHPERAAEISAYHERWPEMLGDAVPGTAELVAELRSAGVPVYALTNFSGETFPLARKRFGFLGDFDGVLVSGQEGVVKPDPAIYALAAQRFGLEPAATLFVDDRRDNVEAARRAGWHAEVFTDAPALRRHLRAAGLLG